MQRLEKFIVKKGEIERDLANFIKFRNLTRHLQSIRSLNDDAACPIRRRRPLAPRKVVNPHAHQDNNNTTDDDLLCIHTTKMLAMMTTDNIPRHESGKSRPRWRRRNSTMRRQLC